MTTLRSGIGALFSLLLMVAFALPAQAAALTGGTSTDERSPDEIFEAIQEAENKAPREWFETLGKMKSHEALDALEASVEVMTGRYRKEFAFTAMRHCLDDSDLAKRAIDFTMETALDKDLQAAQAAAAAMSRWGEPAEPALFKVALKGKHLTARALAIYGLHAALVARADDTSLSLVLDVYDMPASGSLDQAVRLLKVFRTGGQFRSMAQFVKQNLPDLRKNYAVIDAMAEHPLGEDSEVDEGADRVLSAGLKVDDPAIQFRALKAVARRGSSRHEKLVKKLSTSKDDTLRRAATLATIRMQTAASEGDRVLGRKRLDVVKLASAKDPVMRQAAAISLSEQGGDEALQLLHKLVDDEDWTVRVEAVQALVRVRDRSSIPFLISRLLEAKGRMLLDYRSALTLLTGMDLGLGPANWQKFWDKEGESFKLPTLEAAKKAADERTKRRAQSGSRAGFYGLDVVSDSFAFVLDTSGSMNAKVKGDKTRLDAAKVQIGKTLERLKDGVLFNIISFSTDVDSFSDELVPLKRVTRKTVQSFVDDLDEAGGTNIHDAMFLAFEDDRIDTIYLLSDGAPSAGPLTDVLELRAEVDRWNMTRGVVIHTIAVGQDHPLLRGLAEDSGGIYVRVD